MRKKPSCVAVLLVISSLFAPQLAAAGPLNAASIPLAASTLQMSPVGTSPFRVDLVTGKWTYVRPGAAPVTLKSDPLKQLRRVASLKQRLDRLKDDKPRNAWDGNGWCYDVFMDTYEPCFMEPGGGESMGGSAGDYAEFEGDAPWWVRAFCAAAGIAGLFTEGAALAVAGGACGTIDAADMVAKPISDAVINDVNNQNAQQEARMWLCMQYGGCGNIASAILPLIDCLGMPAC
jgi:hypothetical protein